VAIGVGTAVVAIATGLFVGNLPVTPGPTAVVPVAAAASPTSLPTITEVLPSPTASPSPTLEPTPTLAPTAEPTPVRVAAPLTGRLVSPEAARRHPIAVMIDDHSAARPQSGFSRASVVWQAPAEGGIPRYMLVFQEDVPEAVGPVRSARSYYIAWAAEWRSMYVHAGGSPQAQSTLASKGAGQLVYNADQFRYGSYFWRVRTRSAPHNLYTDGPTLRRLARTVNADDGPLTAAWKFAADPPLESRPTGGRIDVAYQYNSIRFNYDRDANAYVRSVSGASPQKDAADGQVVAPKNVVIMVVRFSALNDGSSKNRLEAQVIGSGTAWIASNGRTVKGTWKKTSLTSPTTFQDGAGNPVTFTAGQTFIEVLPDGSSVRIADGPIPTAPPTPSPIPIPQDF
jgi:hypothetical protein